MQSAPAMDAEFAFVAACSARGGADLRAMAVRVADWDRVATLATRHRVIGFVVAKLDAIDIPVPPEVRILLASRARRNTEHNLRNLGEEARIDAGIRAGGAAPLFLKGTALGLKLYGSLAIKTSWDIDILVAPGEIARAGAALRELGYQPQLPAGIGLDDLDRYSAVEKEVIWSHPARGTAVELHGKLTYYTGMLPSLTARAARQSLPAGTGRSIETFADAELYAYLCVHGTLHGWARLKWLADLNAMIDGCGVDVATLHRHAQAIGAGRASAVGLILCRDVLGRAIDAPVADVRVSRMVQASRALIDERGGHDDAHFDRPANTVRLLWLHAGVMPGWRAGAGTTWAIVSRRRWRFQLRLPALLVPLSTVAFAPARFAYRVLRHHRRG